MNEARSWLRRLTSGTATESDVAALNRWRAASPAHAKAFAEAALLWNVMGDAVNAIPAPVEADFLKGRILSRRVFVGGGLGLAASFSAWAIIQPPFDLWPSFSELNADYRTQIGEQRQIKIAEAVALELNTRTSIDLRPSPNNDTAIELLSGEATIAKRLDPARPFTVLAGRGRATINIGSFDIRKDDRSVCVTCITGEIIVRHLSGTVSLQSQQQVRYDEKTLGPVTSIDTDVVTAWQRGLLIFRDTPLASVIDEVNRYRPGKIVLMDEKLGKARVAADFRLDDLDSVIKFITRVMSVPARSLPGGIVLLG